MSRPTTRPHSVRDRSRGLCPYCPDGRNEWALDETNGKLLRHTIDVNGKRTTCVGSGEFPTYITHDPDMAIAKIARVSHGKKTGEGSFRKPRRKGAGARKALPIPAVTVTRIDPKVWAEACRLARRLGSPRPTVMFRMTS